MFSPRQGVKEQGSLFALQGGGRETNVQQLPYFSLVKYNNKIDAVSILELFFLFFFANVSGARLLATSSPKSKVVDAWIFMKTFRKIQQDDAIHQGLVNVPIEHHPSIGDTISNRYLKVMFEIPKKGHLPTHVHCNPMSSQFRNHSVTACEKIAVLRPPGTIGMVRGSSILGLF